MPQISQLAATYGGQLFWLLLTFGAIYFVVGRGMVPKIQATVETRDARISDDLAAARSANEAADRAADDYRTRSNAARDEARVLTQATATEAAREAEVRMAAVSAELDTHQAAAEMAIDNRRQAAREEIHAVAAEAARSIVSRLSPIQVTQAEAAQAVATVSRG